MQHMQINDLTQRLLNFCGFQSSTNGLVDMLNEVKLCDLISKNSKGYQDI